MNGTDHNSAWEPTLEVIAMNGGAARLIEELPAKRAAGRLGSLTDKVAL